MSLDYKGNCQIQAHDAEQGLGPGYSGASRDSRNDVAYSISQGDYVNVTASKYVLLSGTDLLRGGRWSICYCANYDAGQGVGVLAGAGQCNEMQEFHSLAGILTVMGPSPNNQDQTCTAGAPCTLLFTGESLSALDSIAFVSKSFISRCGVTASDFRIAHDTVRALSMLGSGVELQLSGGEAGDIPLGGQWLMCYCVSAYGGCSLPEHFPALAGVFTVLGPSSNNQDQFCTSGAPCTLTFTGQGLSTADKVAFIPALGLCGVADLDINLTGNVHVLHQRHGIGQGRYQTVLLPALGTTVINLGREDLTQGGVWRMCYCTANHGGCDDATDFKALAGTLSVMGSYAQDYHCVAGAPCQLGGSASLASNVGGSSVFDATTVPQRWPVYADGETTLWEGLELVMADKVRLVLNSSSELNFCGQDALDARSLDSDIRVVLGGSDSTADLPLGGRWKVCYCVNYYGGCDDTADFTGFVGILIVKGPNPNSQDQTCTAGQPCTLGPFVGEGLAAGDTLLFAALLGHCGLSGQDLGPAPIVSGQHEVLTSGVSVGITGGLDCTLGPLLGQDISAEDRVTFVTTAGHYPGYVLVHQPVGTCGDLAAIQDALSFAGAYKPVTAGLTVSLVASDLPRGGEWKVCYCTGGGDAGCTGPADFGARLGILTVLGPSPNNQDVTCIAGRPCSLGGFTGQGLSISDRVQLVVHSIGAACGSVSAVEDTSRDADAFQDAAQVIGSGLQVSLLDADLPYGGQWLMCYCVVSAGCSSHVDFAQHLGMLSVRGVAPTTQSHLCIAGVACTLGELSGFGLSTDDYVGIIPCTPAVGSVEVASCCASEDWPSFDSGGGARHKQIQLVSSKPVVLLAASDVPPGGTWAMCQCVKSAASAAGCFSTQNAKVPVGLLTVVGPSSSQAMPCSAGTACTSPALLGTDIQQGDLVALLSEGQCGLAMPSAAAGAGTAKYVDGSLKFDLKGLDLPIGTRLSVCHCAQRLRGCESAEDFGSEAALLSVRGPDLATAGTTWSCAAGFACQVGAFTGQGLSAGDKVLLIPLGGTCGYSSGDGNLPASGGSRLTVDSNLQVALSDTQLTNGGRYRVCYCAVGGGASCAATSAFAAKGGLLKVTGAGPVLQNQLCFTGEACTFVQLAGVGLLAADEVAVIGSSFYCGAGAILASGTIGAGWTLVLTSTQMGSLGGTGNFRLCFCSSATGSCGAAATYPQFLGVLQVSAPPSSLGGRSYRCYADVLCSLLLRTSAGMLPSDRVQLITASGVCGSASPVGGVTYQASGSGSASETRAFQLGAAGAIGPGSYKICHCPSVDGSDADVTACSSNDEFATDVGSLDVQGASSLGDMQGVAGKSWTLGPWTTHSLSSFDRVIFVPDATDAACGSIGRDVNTDARDQAGLAVPRVAQAESKQFSATATSGEFTVKLAAGDVPYGGRWQICHCPQRESTDADEEPCSTAADFATSAGVITVVGPAPNSQDRTCTAGSSCILGGNLGGGFVGQGLSTNDKLSLVHSGGTCGQTAQDLTVFGSVFLSIVKAGSSTFTHTLAASTLSSGGRWKVCYCARGSLGAGGCSATTDFPAMAGYLTAIGPHTSTQDQTCNAGISCALYLVGESMQVGKDLTMLIPSSGTCGSSARDSSVARGNTKLLGTSFSVSLGQADLPKGGQWILCYCATISGSCPSDSYFSVRVGMLSVLGPSPNNQDRFCTAGKSCDLSGLTGFGLSRFDRVRAIDPQASCGYSARTASPVFAGEDKPMEFDSLTSTTELSLSSSQLPFGGRWKLCYCTGMTGSCDENGEFGALLGLLLVYGPASNSQDVGCTAGLDCKITITGYANPLNPSSSLTVSTSDRLALVLNNCGLDDRDPSIGADSYHVVTYSAADNAHSVTLPGTDTGSTTRGGVWNMCYCAAGAGNTCATGSDFATRLGVLTLYGPSPNTQDHTCITGVACTVTFTGQRLGMDDRVFFIPRDIGTCGVTAADSQIAAGDAKHVQADVSVSFIAADLPVGGQWKMCYCSDDSAPGRVCGGSGSADFGTSAGVLTVLGPNPSTQQITCVAGFDCSFTLTGEQLGARDRVALVPHPSGGSCGQGERDRRIAGDMYRPVGAGGALHILAADLPFGGQWRVCYCAGDYRSCDNYLDFNAEAGVLTIAGPTSTSQDKSCTAGVACIVPGSSGISAQGRSSLDKVALVDKDSACGDAAAAVLSTGSGSFRPLDSDFKMHLAPFDIPNGGIWKMCYCFSIALGPNTGSCASLSEFRTSAGLLKVLGTSSSAQDSSCVAGASCTVGGAHGLQGELTKGQDKVAFVAAATGSCGATLPDANLAFGSYQQVPWLGKVELTGSQVQKGGRWYICFCSAGYGGCNSFGDFTDTAGILTVLGPSPNSQNAACSAGFACVLTGPGGLSGQGLSSASDKILFTSGSGCGQSDKDCHVAQDSYIVAGTSQVSLTAHDLPTRGTWKICYCTNNYRASDTSTGCSSPLDYTAIAGQLTVKPVIATGFTFTQTHGSGSAGGGFTAASEGSGLPRALLEWHFDDAQLAEDALGAYSPYWDGSTLAQGSGTGLIATDGGPDRAKVHHLDLLGADAAQVWVEGRIGGAARFDGTQVWGTPHVSIQVPASSLGLPTAEVSLAAWVKVSSFTERAGLVGFLQDGARQSAGWALLLSADGRAHFAVASVLSSATLLRDPANLLSTPVFSSGSWRHLVGTYDGTHARLFMDGSEVDSRSLAVLDGYRQVLEGQNHTCGDIRYVDTYFAVGALRDEDEHIYFQGDLDEVQVYEVALSPKEVNMLYSSYQACTIFHLQCMITDYGHMHLGSGDCSQRSTSTCWYGMVDQILWNVLVSGRTVTGQWGRKWSLEPSGYFRLHFAEDCLTFTGCWVQTATPLNSCDADEAAALLGGNASATSGLWSGQGLVGSRTSRAGEALTVAGTGIAGVDGTYGSDDCADEVPLDAPGGLAVGGGGAAAGRRLYYSERNREVIRAVDLGASSCFAPGVVPSAGSVLLANQPLFAARECQALCQTTAGCLHFSFAAPKVDGRGDLGLCTLLAGTTTAGGLYADIISAPGFLSGPAHCPLNSVTHVAGVRDSPGFSGDGGDGALAQFHQPVGITFAPNGLRNELYLTDELNHRIRKMNVGTGNIVTVAGTGSQGFNPGDDTAGNALLRKFDSPGSVAVDHLGKVYISDMYNQRVRLLDVGTGQLSTLAGSGPYGLLNGGYAGDGGQASQARLAAPRAVVLYGSSLFDVELQDNNHRVRVVDLTSRIITKVAGIGHAGATGDGGAALSATFNFPYSGSR
ncbi:unnamed protein product [Polarella glacialis]|uniref:Uncharacterized protein n=1 Tax=Polarella glacialis TaxID=89957 RepID=A0A813LDC8_POLGL|nr:unnamed protein product [Polarella glacialis]